MDPDLFSIIWKELQIRGGPQVIVLKQMLAKCLGTCTIGGFEALKFEPANPDADILYFRTVLTENYNSHCLQWDPENEKWNLLGMLHYANEWGPYLLRTYWTQSAIRLPGSAKATLLADIFSECQGERHGGLLFSGKGKFDGEQILIRLDDETPLDTYSAPQRCERFNRETDEWEFWGMFLKPS